MAVLNEDDERVRKFAEGFPGRVVTFGFSQNATVPRYGSEVWIRRKCSAIRVTTPDWTSEFHPALAGQT